MSSGPVSGSPFRTLPLDAGGVASVGRLRLLAAVASLGAAIWLVAIQPAARGWWCVLAGVLATALFLGLWARGRRVVRRAADHRVELDPRGVRLVEGARDERASWSEIVSIHADEERLVVLVERAAGEPLAIEPRYGGLGLYELAAAIEDARSSAPGEGCASGGPSLHLTDAPSTRRPSAPRETR